MKDFLYQIKGRKEDSNFGGWCWPPMITGKVSAKDKKEARKLINEEHEREFPMRVTGDKKETEPFLLNIREIKENDERTLELFVFKECKECNSPFRVIDKYNDENNTDKGREFCSTPCAVNQKKKNSISNNHFASVCNNDGSFFIYKIHNKITQKSYIGRTVQAFTLRWYQHFYQGSGTPFHEAIKESKVTDWEFSILEVVKIDRADFTPGVDYNQLLNDTMTEREAYWINFHDTINSGYNTMPVIPKR